MPSPAPVIGVDFDNTIVCYDALFQRVAREQGLIAPEVPATKEAVRDDLRRRGQEAAWTELQGYIYGPRLAEAAPFPGVREFFARCVRQKIAVRIISHKTRHPYRGPRYDLHQTARAWLTAQGFFDPAQIGLAPDHVYFDLSLAEKLARIAQTGCTHFIDDLPELLAEPGFPVDVTPILFSPSGRPPAAGRFQCAVAWADLAELLLGHGEGAHAG